jgi:Xaa-Pro aminopeptidase
MDRQPLPLLLVTDLINIFYLTGFRGSAGVAIVGPSESLLWVDPRYTLQAKEEAREVEVIEYRGELLKAAGRWLRRRKLGRIGYEDSHLTCREFQLLARESGRLTRWKPAGGLIEELRTVKGPEEIAPIRGAGKLTCEVFEEVLPMVRPGARESDLAAEVEYRMKRKGADGAAFETIVASGPRAAFPHARASAKLLKKSELVIFDLGAILTGYAADMTRTLYLGEPPRRVRRLYEAVWEAQREAVENLHAGVRAGQVDSAARRVLARRGLARYFTHSTGHGVGLEIHERPRLGRGEKTRLENGCVVTAEPGIYLKGFGGVRLEDTVLVGAEGPEVLTPASKERWFIQ